MKKKIIYIILILCSLILLTGVGAVVIQYNKEKDEQSSQTAQLSAEEYLLLHANEKASEKDDAIWFIEKQDAVFNVKNAEFKKMLNELSSYSIDTVYLRASVFYNAKKDGADYEPFIKRLEQVVSLIRQKGKKCAVVFDSSFIGKEFVPVLSLGDKIVISGLQGKSSSDINKITSSLQKLINSEGIKIKKEIIIPDNFQDKSSIDFSKLDSIYLPVKDKTQSGALKQWKSFLKDSECTITAGFYFEDSLTADSVLKMVYELDSDEKITTRCYSSMKAVSENKLNCFGAVHRYITDGIVPELAFRKLSVVGYEGETVNTNEASAQITLTGSNVFPFIYNGEECYTDETGSKKITLQFKEGENSFSFSLNGEKLVYKANYAFEGELIESVFPADTLNVSPGEEIEVMVIAYSMSEITVKLGTQQFPAEAEEKENPCYTAFTAKIKMPSSYEELSSVGSITVIATYNGESVQKKGAIISAHEGITFKNDEEKQSTTEKIQNYIPYLPEGTDSDEISYSVTTPSLTEPVIIEPSQGQAAKRMCVITSGYADTWRAIDNDDTFVPYYTPLCQGTMDYIVGESQAYNSDDEKTVHFYDLASGRKVRQEAVQVIETAPYKDNNLSVLSSTGENGTLTIKIRTDWKVPYSLDYSPQNYFAAYRKLFNVSSFTADTVEFTFYHTVSAQGEIDVSTSDVLSSAVLSESGDKTAKLTLKLKNAGGYYGSSINYDRQGNMVITVNNKPKALSGAVIMLDPGHGGSEPGAVGIGSAVLEKDVNLAIAHQTKLALEEMGATVIMTRNGNDTLTLEQRKAIMRQYKPDLFVAIHSNGSYNTQEKGTSTYYFKPFSRDLAENIYEELLSVYKNNVYAGQVELFDDISDGVIYYPFSVTRVEECPSVLIEVGYMTNDEECYELIDGENQKLFGKAVANGIARTISE